MKSVAFLATEIVNANSLLLHQNMKRYESLVLVLANCRCLLNLLPKFNLGVKYKPGNQELVDEHFKIIFYIFDVSFISFSFIHDPTSGSTFTLLGLNKDYYCYYIIHNGKTLFKNINMNNDTIHHLQG